MQKILQRYYFKIRIILTFCIVTFILVVLMSRVSYQYIRELYLEQLSQHVQAVVEILGKNIEKKFIKLVEIGQPGNITKNYFGNFIKKYQYSLSQSQFFIFDSSFTILIHSDDSLIPGKSEPRLTLNKTEIYGLEIQSSSASLPFKGDDDNWYLWAFFRIDTNLWLGMQESAKQLQKVEEFSLLFWYIGFAGILITVILGLIVGRTITRPIDRLSKFSSQIGGGELLQNAPPGMKGEIKILSDAMDKMRLDILKSHKEKEQMLAQIAHEIRNPLGGIELLANLTKEDMAKGISNSEYLDNILKEIGGLKLLITAYLDYSRPHPAKPEWIDLNVLFNDISSLFENELERKNIEIKKVIKNEKILFDAVHLKQILINLITNGIEVIKNNGTIIVSSSKNKNDWIICVDDNGPGIKNEHIDTIFDPFFTTKKEGTGLGLAISKKLCEENNAIIRVENNEKNGSTFTISKSVSYG